MAKKKTSVKKQAEVSTLTKNLFNKSGVEEMKFEDQTWDQVDAIYKSIAEYIMQIGNDVSAALDIIKRAGVHSNEIMVTITGVTKDLQTFTSELLHIKSLHDGKTGIVANGDDYALTLSVYTDYVNLFQRIRALTFDSMLTVTETLTEAVNKLKDAVENIEDAEVITEPKVEGNVNE